MTIRPTIIGLLWALSLGAVAIASQPAFSVNGPTNQQVLAYDSSIGYFTNQSLLGNGTVTRVAGVAANGIIWSIVNPTTSPAITIGLGAIVPVSVNGLTITSTSGILTITNLKRLSVANTLAFAGVDGSTLTFQATGTVVNRDSTDTLTNKTYNTAGTGNVFQVNGAQLTDLTGGSLLIGAGHLTLSGDASAPGNSYFYGTNGAGVKGWYLQSSASVVDAIAGTANQIAASSATGNVTLSLAGPHGFATQTAHGVILGEGTAALAASAAGTTGQAFLSGGASADGAFAALNLGGGSSIVTGALPNANLANSSISIAGNAAALGGSVTQDAITGLSSTGIVKRTGANALAIATAGSDYAAAPSGSSILAANGAGGFSNATATQVFTLLGNNGGTNSLLYTFAANALTALAAVNSAMLTTSAGGVPQYSTTLPTGLVPALTGDVTNSAGSLATTVGKIGGNAVSLGGAFTMAGGFTFNGTITGNTAVIFPTSGTLATTAGTVTAVSVATANGFSGSSSGGTTPALTIVAGAITPVSVNGLALVSAATGFTIAGGTTSKTATIAGNFTTAHGDDLTLTTTGATNVTLPTSGTLLAGNQTITLSGDTTGSGSTAITTTTPKVNGVAYPTSPSTNTVPVVTGTNAVTYETVPNAALANSTITIGGVSTALGGSALSSVTNDTQTKAAVVPNTAPASGDLLIGNAGGTAYAHQAMSGDASIASTGAITVTKVNGVVHPSGPSANTVPVVTSAAAGGTVTYEAVPNAALANSTITIGGSSTALGGSALGSVTNDAQTKAAIVPNTTPTAGQILVGNAGNTAYAPVTMGGNATMTSAGVVTVSSATNATNVATISTSTNAAFYPLFVASAANSNQSASLNSNFSVNPSTGTVNFGIRQNLAGTTTNSVAADASVTFPIGTASVIIIHDRTTGSAVMVLTMDGAGLTQPQTLVTGLTENAVLNSGSFFGDLFSAYTVTDPGTGGNKLYVTKSGTTMSITNRYGTAHSIVVSGFIGDI